MTDRNRRQDEENPGRGQDDNPMQTGGRRSQNQPGQRSGGINNPQENEESTPYQGNQPYRVGQGSEQGGQEGKGMQRDFPGREGQEPDEEDWERKENRGSLAGDDDDEGRIQPGGQRQGGQGSQQGQKNRPEQQGDAGINRPNRDRGDR
jgi:hypothetical protein